MSEMNGLVLIERREATSIVTFNEPARMNPFSEAMRRQAADILAAEMADRAVRAIVLTGAGGQFSAGGDIRQMAAEERPDPARFKRRLELLHGLVRLVAGGPKPVVAAVEGVAFGAGLSLAAACDFVVAGEGARFGAAFGRIGLTADCGLLWSLPQRIGLGRAKDMMFTGRPVGAEEAVRIGLADRLVPAGTALVAALDKTAEYLDTAPLSIAAMKAGLAEAPCDLESALRLEGHQQPMLGMTADHTEGRHAFLQKRRPHFTGA